MVGDEIFQLKDYLIHPYPEIRSAKLHVDQTIFKYRLSIARSVRGNCFGNLAARWRLSVDLLVLIKKMLLVACQHEFFYTISFNKQKTHLIAVKFRGF